MLSGPKMLGLMSDEEANNNNNIGIRCSKPTLLFAKYCFTRIMRMYIKVKCTWLTVFRIQQTIIQKHNKWICFTRDAEEWCTLSAASKHPLYVYEFYLLSVVNIEFILSTSILQYKNNVEEAVAFIRRTAKLLKEVWRLQRWDIDCTCYSYSLLEHNFAALFVLANVCK